jgi:tetratricopeptide (TPR) repeat protein
MPNARITVAWTALVAVVLFSTDRVSAQSFRRGGTEFNAVRSVAVPAGKPSSIVVAEFLHHGEIRPDGRNVVVAAQNKELVPFRILQLGPGDFCRLAFQTVKGQTEYDIFYGGEPPAERPPAWTCRDGLLLETRQFKYCNFNSLDSVRNAFNAAAPIGADYVDAVFHGENPFSLKREPFLSRYSGYLDLDKAGTYGFIASSQDCSFLLIDGKLAASAPGRHGPLYRAHRGVRYDVKLSAGEHRFEYYHAAAGPNAVMVAAWEIDPPEKKPQQPAAIPSEVFRAYLAAHLPAGNVSLRTTRLVPDFLMKIAGDVPLPDNDVPLVGVLFRDASPKALTMQGAKIEWDFGDGQTSDLPNPDHVYLHPGLYTMKLLIRRGGKSLEMANRLYIDRPLLTHKDKLHSLDQYLKIIETYDPKALDAVALRQLVLALEAKSLAAESRAEDAANKAVAAGKAAFVDDSAAKGDEDLLKLAQLIGPMARHRLGDSETAFQIWQGAAARIAAAEPKAECESMAADIALNDLLNVAATKPLLEAATKRLGQGKTGPIAASLRRVWGDYYAATGDSKAARNAYTEAEQLVGNTRRLIEKTASRGAHARSTEEFINQKQFARAAEEIQSWQREFPTEKIDGYLTLLCARYWAGRGKYAQAVAQAEQLLAVSPDSPYIDQALFVSANSDMRRGRKDRALATLRSLLKDYPGSPLVPLAKKNIAALEGEKEEK